MRLLSLAPTQTEILAALGAFDDLVGVSDNCDFPEAVKTLERFGSWAAPDLHRVRSARPDLVCTFGRHQQEVADLLRSQGITVYHSDPTTITEALETFRDLAALTHRAAEGERLLGSLKGRLQAVRERAERIRRSKRPRVLRIMHWEPLITVGPGAFQHDVIETAGAENIAADGTAPYFTCDPADLARRDPDFIFFCDPALLDRLPADPVWKTTRAVREGRVRVFDCGLTCRSGPRIVDMTEALQEAVLNPPPTP
jgi:iron complex transport system substrate-binding protein